MKWNDSLKTVIFLFLQLLKKCKIMHFVIIRIDERVDIYR